MSIWRSLTARPSSAHFAPSTSKPPNTTPKTSMDKTVAMKSQPTQNAPLLSLPLELVQYIATFLDDSSAASFCLSSRYLFYAIGRKQLMALLQLSRKLSVFQRRINIEILERAFTSHWFCAWCDTFHAQDVDGGPNKFSKEASRDCAEFNSFLHDGWDYVLCYHHVRLVMNRELWGKEYGMSLEDFTHDGTALRKMGKSVVNTHLRCEARIVQRELILHASFSVSLPPRRNVRSSRLMADLISILPQVVVGHRYSHTPHAGLETALRTVLVEGRKTNVQVCAVCATDFCVSGDFGSAEISPPKGSPESESPCSITISVWRDLGNGRNPFDASWRAHGELGNYREGFANDALRLTRFQSGDIKKAFQSREWFPHRLA